MLVEEDIDMYKRGAFGVAAGTTKRAGKNEND